MFTASNNKEQLSNEGFTIISNVFVNEDIDGLISLIQSADTSKDTFRSNNDLFAIRQCLKEIPKLVSLVFNNRILQIISELFGDKYFIVKSIYFDKPPQSNWFVAWHQDLTISVNRKESIEGFGPWTVKQNQFAVQPPLSILEDNFTIRIHLDDTTVDNGALKIVPGSHAKGIYRPETIDWTIEREVNCEVEKGGIMIMKPLLLHASGRTTSQQQRRVLHIEFSKASLPQPLQWSEYQCLPKFNSSADK